MLRNFFQIKKQNDPESQKHIWKFSLYSAWSYWKGYTFAFDIYSIGMLMWEVSSVFWAATFHWSISAENNVNALTTTTPDSQNGRISAKIDASVKKTLH